MLDTSLFNSPKMCPNDIAALSEQSYNCTLWKTDVFFYNVLI